MQLRRNEDNPVKELELNNSMMKDIESLKKDANRVVTDLVNLTNKVKVVGKETSEEVVADLNQKAQAQLSKLKRDMGDIERRSRQYATTAASHIKENPYLYMVGAIGLGCLVGALSRSRHK